MLRNAVRTSRYGSLDKKLEKEEGYVKLSRGFSDFYINYPN